MKQHEPSCVQCLAITGPTACGKTDLALQLAREYPIEIVSMDSAMVYRGMDIGTAKPDLAVRKEIPHHLIDILDPEETYSAGRFAADANMTIKDIAARKRLALVVGGTMLYLKSLREGLADLPERDDAIRSEIDARASIKGWPALHAELAAIDAAAASRIEPTDKQRIQRALEVHAVTGKPLSEMQQKYQGSGVAIDCFALVPDDRSRLHDSIEQRFEQMVRAGFVAEVERLRLRPALTAEMPSMRAVGYRQVWAHLDGCYDWDEARQRAIAATRQLAKRQLTWLRGDSRSERARAGDPGLADALRQRIERLLKRLTLA